MKPKKTGRPKVDNPKTNIIRVRLDDHTTERLDGYCEKHETSRAEAVREGIELLLDNEK